MKLYFILIIVFFLNNCSFDKKSGIWKNENKIPDREESLFKEFEIIRQDQSLFNQTVSIKKNFNFFINPPLDNKNWLDKFYNNENRFINFEYDDNKKIIFKGKKISRHKLNKNIFFSEGIMILSDEKGNILFFSKSKNEITKKFNFYRNQYKKIKKFLNIIIEKDIIYVSDNLGFLYAYNFQEDKLIWAKNYKIPFKSNLKIIKKTLVAANQNNTVFLINKFNGKEIKNIPTEETLFKNNFINNLATNGENLFFLNSYGSLYAINEQKNIIWFRNFNKSFDINPSNLFEGNEILIHKNKIIITTINELYVINADNGSTIFKKNIAATVNPIVVSKYIFLISKNNYLISISIDNGEIIYSKKLDFDNLGDKNLSKQNLIPEKVMLINNQLYVFFEKTYYSKIDIYGEIDEILKLPSKKKSEMILIDGSLLFIGKKNKLIIYN